jgi:hypothetical protein
MLCCANSENHSRGIQPVDVTSSGAGADVGKPVAWFADPMRDAIGTIALARANKRWTFVLLRRNKLAKVTAKTGRQLVCPSSE